MATQDVLHLWRACFARLGLRRGYEPGGVAPLAEKTGMAALAHRLGGIMVPPLSLCCRLVRTRILFGTLLPAASGPSRAAAPPRSGVGRRCSACHDHDRLHLRRTLHAYFCR